MIVRTLDDLKDSGSYAEKPGFWTSARYLLRDDHCGFTVTQTTVAAGQVLTMQYKNHIEANLLVEGEAILHDIEHDKTWHLSAGSMYTLDKHDKHRLEAVTDLQIVCVFTPALVGTETHDESGSYPVL